MGGWNPQLDELLTLDGGGRPAVRVLLVDNRGVGRSSVPKSRSAYTTSSMAADVLCIMVTHASAPNSLSSLQEAEAVG
jgi:pimeloyl-ACP methyl ester carboxylesterase